MKYLLFLLKVLHSESKKRYFLTKSLFFSLSYISLSMVLINYKSYWSFIISDYDLPGKIKILLLIFLGSFQAVAFKDLALLTLTSLLFGLNVELVLRKVKFLATIGNLHVTFGTGILTLVATGCASCGLSLASIAGLSAVLAALPFGGAELYVVSILILISSLFYNLHTLVKVCKIKKT